MSAQHEDITKRILAIHDLSCFGRCSLQVIIPTISSFGFLVCPVPTAILSTHSGDFEGYTFHDLSDHMVEQLNHWKKLNLTFDCIYPGFLGSSKQVDIVYDYIDAFREKDTLVVVDPVLGDDGELYSAVSPQMVTAMRDMVKVSDIIAPNLTEAALLLGHNPRHIPNSTELQHWLLDLAKLGPKRVMITSAPAESPINIDLVAYDSLSDEFWNIEVPRVPASYPGTGDLFCSLLISHLLSGEALKEATIKTVRFIRQSLLESIRHEYPKREGVLLEQCLMRRNDLETYEQ